MSDVPFDRINVQPHGHWIVRESIAGITHFAWQWNSGMSLGYLCCTEPEWLDSVQLPAADLKVTCVACLGTLL